MSSWAEDQATPNPDEADQKMLSRVAARFFAITPAVEGWAWPPLVGMTNSDEVNAFESEALVSPGEKPVLSEHPNVVWIDVPYAKPQASSERSAAEDNTPTEPATSIDASGRQIQPYLIFHQGFMKKIVNGRDSYLAETFGHELAHAVLRHSENYGDGDTPLINAANTRKHEADADKLGMMLSLQAGFPFDELFQAVKYWKTYERNENEELRKRGLDVEERSSLRALASSHPGWTDRAAGVDRIQPELWASISAFENGVYLLLAEDYPLAERCFTQTITEAPKCYEAWANRGYCRLMKYADGLDAKEVQELGIGQFVVGGFYRIASSVDDRGAEEFWRDGVQDLREAIRLNGSLVMPKVHLALALLIDPAGAQTEEAAELIRQVTDALHDPKFDDPKLNPSDRAAILVNAGVVEIACNRPETGLQHFAAAEDLYRKEYQKEPDGTLRSAILYSEANLLAASEDQENRQRAIARLEEYLKATSPTVVWWDIAYDRYQQVCQTVEATAVPRAKLTRSFQTHFRPVSSLSFGDQKQIVLNDPVENLTKVAGDGIRTTLVRRTGIQRVRYNELGMEFVCTDKVVAMRLNGEAAPPLVIHPSAQGGLPQEIRIGMKFSDMLKLLGGDETGWDQYYGTESGVSYRYFSRLGFGVRLNSSGQLTEILIAKIPERAKLDRKR